MSTSQPGAHAEWAEGQRRFSRVQTHPGWLEHSAPLRAWLPLWLQRLLLGGWE